MSEGRGESNRGERSVSRAWTNADRPMWDYSVIMELTIDRPAKEVWSYFIGEKKNIWTRSSYTTVAGEVGQLGEIYTHAHRAHGNQGFYEAIKVVPEQQLVLKITYRENEDDEPTLAGYDFFSLKEVAGHTTLFFQQAFALPVDQKDFDRASEEQDKKIVDIFQNLKRAVENRQ
jgi:uncharacterized protein YndB with AHSA1/START domain